MSQFTSEEFLQSFLVEADEHLQTILRTLLELEKQFPDGRAGQAESEEDLEVVTGHLHQLLRSLHSLKGISGMVGLSPAADLSHAMESVVKQLEQGQLSFSPALFDRLIRAAQLLEKVVQTVRDPSASLPAIEGMLAELNSPAKKEAVREARPEEAPKSTSGGIEPSMGQTFPPEIAAQLNPAELRKVEAAWAAGRKVAITYYDPVRSEHQAGGKVNQVREWLLRYATLIKAIPLIQEGMVRFAFVVAGEAFPPSEELRFLDWVLIAPEVKLPSALPAPAPEAPLASPAAAGTGSGPAATLRVELSRMDDLMKLVGDLVVTRSRISELVPQLGGANPALLETLEESTETLERQIRYLRQAVMRIRLVPLAEVFSRMPLAVRDLAHTSGKKVQLVVEGSDTELDKSLVERLADPLMHLVRNAVTHGIEGPEERAAAGKPPEGTLRLSGKTEGDHVCIAIEDDGKGIDGEKIRDRARALGWTVPEGELSSQELLDLLCQPGFSTRDTADLGSGRGMGMNAAAEIIAHLGGVLSLETWPGKGTRFVIQLPLTITIVDAFIVRAGGESFAVPQSAVREIIEVFPAQITSFQGRELLPYRGTPLTLFRLAGVFGLPVSSGERQIGLVMGQGKGEMILLVDQVIGLRETVVHPITDPLIARPGISGVTELGDGSVILILDGNEFISQIKTMKPIAGRNG